MITGNNKETEAVKGVPKHVTLHVCRVDKETTVASLTALLNFPEATSHDHQDMQETPRKPEDQHEPSTEESPTQAGNNKRCRDEILTPPITTVPEEFQNPFAKPTDKMHNNKKTKIIKVTPHPTNQQSQQSVL
ncbi:hypothetical protein JTB14_027480 [Gonioctena quinquepunctata]|nr:hypothetical protein JTB14_027480 [Gonioctena quinquepunctata]